jgi:hypothetical protein
VLAELARLLVEPRLEVELDLDLDLADALNLLAEGGLARLLRLRGEFFGGIFNFVLRAWFFYSSTKLLIFFIFFGKSGFRQGFFFTILSRPTRKR